MLVAITGGDSAVGRALQKVLAQRSTEFRTLVPNEPPAEIADMGEHVIGEETDAEKVAELLEGAKVLVHAGPGTISPADDFCQAELASQTTLIPAAHERGIELHYLSTSEVFSPRTGADDPPLSEDSPTEPASPLGVAKLAWEQTLRIWQESKGLRYVVYRVPTVVPEFLSYSSACARYLRAGFKTGEIVPQAREGDRWGLSFVHAEDVACLIADTLGREEAFGQTFHLSANQWVSEQELAEMSHLVLNDFMIPSKMKSAPEDVATGLVGDVLLDATRARETLHLDTSNSVPRLARKLRLWIDDFGSTVRLPVAE